MFLVVFFIENVVMGMGGMMFIQNDLKEGANLTCTSSDFYNEPVRLRLPKLLG